MKKESEYRLEVEHLSFAYDRMEAVRDVSLRVKKGQFVGIIGPNGSGKSTVLKNVYRALKPQKGSIRLDGEELSRMSYRDSAVKMAVVGQENDIPFDFSVEEIVAMGRAPHKHLFELDGEEDRKLVQQAMEHMGLAELAKRSYLYLSGGEKQRTIIARALAQQCDFLILDEPTNHLDIRCQLQIFDFVRGLDVTVLSAIHDLNLAALYCDYLFVLKEGRMVLEGTPDEVLTEENIREIYGVESVVEQHPLTDKRNITFLPKSMLKRPNNG